MASSIEAASIQSLHAVQDDAWHCPMHTDARVLGGSKKSFQIAILSEPDIHTPVVFPLHEQGAVLSAQPRVLHCVRHSDAISLRHAEEESSRQHYRAAFKTPSK